jgi:hypothetical protein
LNRKDAEKRKGETLIDANRALMGTGVCGLMRGDETPGFPVGF